MTSVSRHFGEAVLAHHPGGQPHALLGELEVTVALDGDQAVALHPGDGLGDGGAALVQPLGDPGTQRDDAFLDELVDRPEVHLGGVDQVAHLPIVTDRPRRWQSGGVPAVMWFRRDLRLSDNPALLEAAQSDDRDGEVLPLFVVDPALWGPSGPSRRHYLSASLRDLDSRIGLTIRTGDPVTEVVRAAREVDADPVHVAADFGPYGRARDEKVDAALAEHDIELVRTGSPYAVAPGRVTKGDGTPYQVFTPYYQRLGSPTAGATRLASWGRWAG